MRGACYLGLAVACLSVALSGACGAARDQSGGLGGASGFDGGYGGETNHGQEKENGLVASDPVAPSGAGGSGTGGGAGTGASLDGGPTLPDLCPDVEQTNVELTAVIAGANATGSATAARELLGGLGKSPLPSDVRDQDFVNYYAGKLPATELPLLHLQLSASTIAPYYDLLVALQAPEAAVPRAAVNVSVVVDNTLSLGDEGLARSKAAVGALAAWLTDPADRLTLFTADSDATAKTYDTPSANPELAAAVEALALAPERDATELLPAALQQASAGSVSVKRVVFLSDGEGNPEALPEGVQASAAVGGNAAIRLVALGTGPALPFGHRLLRNAAKLGRGPYAHLDSVAEAQALDFDALFGVWADSVSLRVTLPWFFAFERPFAGDIVVTPAEIEDQYIAPGRTTVFLFKLLACHEQAPQKYAESIAAHASYTILENGIQANASAGDLVGSLLGNPGLEIEKTRAVLAYAEALRSLDGKRLAYARSIVESAQGAFVQLKGQQDPGLAEISTLLAQHPAYPSGD